jgi:Ca2+-binding RTX toxin-like protein
LGIDTFVVRSGDGSTTLSSADAIYDFEDGTDLIGLSSLAFDDLTIAQGSGNYSNHVLVSITSSDEYVAVIQTMSVSNVTALDFVNTSTDAQTVNGTTGNDILIGGSGVDTFNTNTGVDSVYGHAGNDIINVTGTGSKVIAGGSDTDTLVIDYSGISNIGDFVITEASGYTVFTYTNSDTIKFKDVENLTVGDYAYTHDADDNTYWNASEYKLYTYGSASVSDITGLASFAAATNMAIQGGGGAETFNLNINRSSDFTGNLTIDLGAGNDTISSFKIKNADSIDLGAGDDNISFMLGSDQGGAQTLANVDAAKLDGGAGRDTISFAASSAGGTIVLTTAGATNFENIIGTSYADTITGDGNSNYLSGGDYSSNSDTTSDTLNGAAGNDILIGSGALSVFNTVAALTLNGYTAASIDNLNGAGNHTLNGGAGNDILVGARGEDTLDAGTGTDHMFGGLGIDTFVVRSGDGSTTLSSADAIYDFEDGTDLIGLDDSLSFSELTIVQGSGNYSNDTLVSITATGEYLAIVEGINATALTEVDFTPVDIL